MHCLQWLDTGTLVSLHRANDKRLIWYLQRPTTHRDQTNPQRPSSVRHGHLSF